MELRDGVGRSVVAEPAAEPMAEKSGVALPVAALPVAALPVAALPVLWAASGVAVIVIG